jgi:hypothetical protein
MFLTSSLYHSCCFPLCYIFWFLLISSSDLPLFLSCITGHTLSLQALFKNLVLAWSIFVVSINNIELGPNVCIELGLPVYLDDGRISAKIIFFLV